MNTHIQYFSRNDAGELYVNPSVLAHYEAKTMRPLPEICKEAEETMQSLNSDTCFKEAPLKEYAILDLNSGLVIYNSCRDIPSDWGYLQIWHKVRGSSRRVLKLGHMPSRAPEALDPDWVDTEHARVQYYTRRSPDSSLHPSSGFLHSYADDISRPLGELCQEAEDMMVHINQHLADGEARMEEYTITRESSGEVLYVSSPELMEV